jgi:S1-C subfamily serine protease
MKCELRIIAGARAGHLDVFDKSYIGLGRHPLSDVRFDAEKDLDASTRHAAIVKTGDSYLVRDLGSTNGTFVNGERLEADRALKDRDVIKLGVHGPEVSFHLVREDEGEEVIMAAVQAPKAATNPTKPETPIPSAATAAAAAASKRAAAARDMRNTPSAPMPQPAAPSKTSVLRAEVGHQRSRARALGITAIVIGSGALGIVYWQGRQSGMVIAGQDSTIVRMSAELRALRVAQAATDSQKTALGAQLAAEQDPALRQAIRTRIATAERRSTAIQQARGVDYAAIQRLNTAAVAVITVRYPDSTVFEGTAFSLNAQGQMLTNKHNVLNPAGVTARDIAIRFSGSGEVLPARLVRTSPDADLALIQLESAGPFPAVYGLEPAGAAVGAPIALIGYPGGSNNSDHPRAKLVTGSVTIVSDSLLELDAFSGTGASGSPIFDRDGRVIGILYGGRGGASSNEIVGLPIRRAMGLLERE